MLEKSYFGLSRNSHNFRNALTRFGIVHGLTRTHLRRRTPCTHRSAEEDFVDKVVGGVAARLGTQAPSKMSTGNRYVREKESATFLGVSVYSLRSWAQQRRYSTACIRRIHCGRRRQRYSWLLLSVLRMARCNYGRRGTGRSVSNVASAKRC